MVWVVVSCVFMGQVGRVLVALPIHYKSMYAE